MPAVGQLAGEAEGRAGAAFGDAPGVVGGVRQHCAVVVESLAHAAERVGGVPSTGAAVVAEQALDPVYVLLCAVRENLGKRGHYVLGVAGGDAADAGSLRARHQRAVTVVGIEGAATRRHAPKRIVGGGGGAVVDKIARRVIRQADDLISGVVALLLRYRTVRLHDGTVAHPVVLVGVIVATACVRACEAVQAIVAVGNRPGRGGEGLGQAGT